MYFVPLIRDYIELVNTFYEGDTNIQNIVQQSLLFLAQNFKTLFVYFISFQWLRDFFYLPALIPQYSDSILRENFFLETPLENIFNFLENPSFTQNKIVIGFLNSLFLSLPFSCSQLIYLRRFLIQGKIAGLCAGLGTIFGQIFFISSVLFGVRFVVIPWFSLGPLNFFFGVFLLLKIVYDFVHERSIKILVWNKKKELLKIFFLNFFLIWTEQSCIFQYLGNLTIEAQPTSLDIFTSENVSTFFINHFNYILGLLLGCFFFTLFFAFLLQNLSDFIAKKIFLLKTTWLIRLNFLFLTCILAFTFTSIPFYGLDFLITSPLGFVSEDKVLKGTFLNLKKDPFYLIGDGSSFFIDLEQFDRGDYFQESFEELNYPLDYGSVFRQGDLSLYDEYKTKFRELSNLFFKKETLQKEKTQTTDLENNKNLKKNVRDRFIEYPTYYVDPDSPYWNSSVGLKLQNRYENYKEPTVSFFESFSDFTENWLNSFFWKEKHSLVYPELDKKIKQKFFTSPIFNFLLNIDIDNLIKRQPPSFFLSPNQEKQLFEKRLKLSRYYDTLRLYKNIPYTKKFEFFFNGSKSFADRVYNQKFKGTLRAVRRLFSLQPTFEQVLYKENKELNHEELNLNTDCINNYQNSFKNFNNPTPLYIGWDEELKKITITNRFYKTDLKNSFFSKKD